MSIDSKFQTYHADNPTVYKLFKRFAEQAKRAGFTNYSARTIFHRMRWHINIETKDPDGFKINNNHSRGYAQMLMDECPEFDGFFRTREQQKDWYDN